jgi:hypothetical protein
MKIFFAFIILIVLSNTALTQDLSFKPNCIELLKSMDNQTQFEIFLIKNEFVLTDVLNETSYHYFADGTEGSYRQSIEMPSNNPSDSLNPHKNYVKGLNMGDCYETKDSKKTWAWRYTEETKRAFVWINIYEYIETYCNKDKSIKFKSVEISFNISTNENYNHLEQEFLKCCKYVGISYRDGELAHEYTYFNPITKKSHTIYFVKRLEKSGGDVYFIER